MESVHVTRSALAALLVIAAGSAFAQSPHQRAPGVPMTPDPATVVDRELIIEQGVRAPGPQPLVRQHAAQMRAERDLPMPRPVPSIISP